MARSSLAITGIDFTSGYLHAARCVETAHGLRLHELFESSLPPGSVVDGVVSDPQQVGTEIRSLLAPQSRLPRTVVAALPDSATYLLTLTIPNVEEHERREAVLWEASQHLPVPVEELTVDWSVRETTPQGIIVDLAATSTALVQSYVKTLEAAGLSVFALEPLALSPLRVFAPDALKTPSILLRMDSYVNTLLFVTPSGTIPMAFTTQSFSKGRIDMLLAEQLKLDAVERRKAIEMFGLEASGNDGRVRTALLKEFETFAKEAQEQHAYVERTAALRFGDLYLIGQPSMRGLTEALTTALGVTVHDDATAFCAAVSWNGSPLPAGTLSRLAGVLGLALYPA